MPKPKSGDNAGGKGSADMLEGHRNRLRARFDNGETLADYEMLELVLFRAIPRRDTKPIAKAMIAKFGSFAEALSAPVARLTEIDGVGARVVSDMRVVRAAAERFALAELRKRPTLSSTEAVAEYYRIKLKSAEREEFHILFLDKRNQYLASECAGVGTVDHTPVYPREVIARALTHGATAVVLVHNHPSGDPTPSRADVTMTEQIIRATAAVNVSMHDHIIIAGHRYLSMRSEGFI
ncbi:DNA repair protein RadC [Acuticoccus sp. MNP-M23]|uniref:RadC family protein n=1 Tax=Acuticoccus sp. MNP-M23 TaxID=3072793 RepID=UPI002815B6EC|nr:DNA repair protein RadC [Acuticoccus sp. MNP-M23]WMS41173.1 DNA repair protein RadC [Acuticoccus sp. MNP-M23]